ncbi:hypothetical protein BABINDRAFT_158978 [Babjeviella inositovora NRRL Y-12698]|uniref:FMP27 GFWDK domain-containing protein n=1 Tax=Babjeviella inositovora NRRL Y-12698 TaxID=984486 RepID=A0A1E3QXH1_9ASCO|nr:uncharacterized protein BABINDRAFT_158978 [Babjeviella inositovora NRRL Y-12698]ODQ82368.1 hypothetical protein BABINDRAFT_158978 [Babjeviella inositovora NRRL Y-12698]
MFGLESAYWPYLAYLALILVGLAVLAKWGLYAFTGVYIGSINPFMLRVSSISITQPGVSINIRSLYLRLNLWDRKERLKFVADSTHIVVHVSTNTNQNNPDSMENAQKPIPVLSIYPREGRAIVQFLLAHLPATKILLKDTSVLVGKLPPVTAYRLEVSALDHATVDNSWKLSLSTLLSQVEWSGQYLDTLRLEVSTLIDRKTGVLSRTKVRVFVFKLTASLATLLKINEPQVEIQSPPKSSDLQPHSKDFELHANTGPQDSELRPASDLDSMAMWLELLETSIDEVTFHLENIKVDDIPFLSNFHSVEAGLTDSLNHFLQFRVKSSSTTHKHLDPLSPGYDLHFRLDERASQVVSTSSLVQLNLWHRIPGKKPQRVPLAAIPSLSLSIQSNFWQQFGVHLRYDSGWAACRVVGAASVSSPTVDLSTAALALAVFNGVLVQRYQLYKMGKPGKGTSDWDIPRSAAMPSALAMASSLLPVVNVKLTLEQPALIIKHRSDTLRLTKLSLALLSLQIGSRGGRYETSLDVLNVRLGYRENDTHLADILHIQNLGVRGVSQKSGRFATRVDVTVTGVRVDLCAIPVLLGISRLLTETLREFRILKASDAFSVPDELQTLQSPSVDDRFGELPPWLETATISVTQVDIVLGSKSVFDPAITSAGATGSVACKIAEVDAQLTKEAEGSSLPWGVKVQTRGLAIVPVYENTLATAKYEKFLRVPNVTLEFYPENINEGSKQTVEYHPNGPPSSRRLTLDVEVSRVESYYSVYCLFVMVGAASLLQATVVGPLREATALAALGNTIHSNPIPLLLRVNVTVAELDVVLEFSELLKMRIQVSEAHACIREGRPAEVAVQFVRLLLESPTVPGFWTRLACVDAAEATIDTKKQPPSIDVRTAAIRIVMPNQLRLYRLFDLLALTAKVAKQLVYSLGHDNVELVVQLEIELAVQLPDVALHTAKVMMAVEDDPFESELNGIFQLGLLEQAQRTEKLRQLALRTADENTPQHATLMAYFSRSWIRRVRAFKAKSRAESIRNVKYLYGGEARLAPVFARDVLAPAPLAPLLSVALAEVDVRLSEPQFADLRYFLYRMGQGLPDDTPWTLLVPMYVELTAQEARGHIRDYPLPLFWVPRAAAALSVKGHLVLGEKFDSDPKNMRDVWVPLVPVCDRTAEMASLVSTVIPRTLAPMWCFMDMAARIDTQRPAAGTWGVAYRAALKQLLLSFDNVTKPPVDRSPKVGVWDKMRQLVHGRFELEVANELHIHLKGSRDPYALLGTAGGFTLGFVRDVRVDINSTDDLRDFLGVRADEVNWTVPNHLAQPLLVWCRETDKAVLVPTTRAFLNSTFAYFLHADMALAGRAPPIVGAKTCVVLTGGIFFGLGYMFERNAAEGRTFESVPFHKLQLCNPALVPEGHDAYAGFRSEYVHMAITVTADGPTSRNAISLSPRSLRQFIDWWHLFAGNMDLPVRQGRLFGLPPLTTALSERLATFKFQFVIAPITVLLMYHDQDTIAGDHMCIGVKGRVEALTIDLHQRKEAAVEHHEALGRNKKVMKMILNVGQVDVKKIDVRLVEAVLSPGGSSEGSGESSDDSSDWVEAADFEEFLQPSVAGHARRVRVLPLMLVPRMVYVCDVPLRSKPDGKPLGSEPLHECLIGDNKGCASREQDNDRVREILPEVPHTESARTGSAKAAETGEAARTTTIDAVAQAPERHAQADQAIDLQAADTECEETTGGVKVTGTGSADFESALSESISSHTDNADAFQNRFTLHDILLKWDNETRNLLYKFVHYIKLRGAIFSFLKHDAFQDMQLVVQRKMTRQETLIMGMINDTSSLNSSNSGDSSPNTVTDHMEPTCADRLAGFNTALREVLADQVFEDEILIQLISPQIQLTSIATPDASINVISPLIEVKIVAVLEKPLIAILINDKVVEKRFGVMLHDATIYLLPREAGEKLCQSDGYGSSDKWPPWLDLRVFSDQAIHAQHLLIEQTSIMLRYDQVNALVSAQTKIRKKASRERNPQDADTTSDSDSARSRMSVDIPRVVVSCTSKQYFTLYLLILDLLIYSEPMLDELSERLAKLSLLIDLNDLQAIPTKIRLLVFSFQALRKMANNYNFRQHCLDNEQLNDYTTISMEQLNILAELYLLMKAITMGNQANSELLEWNICADLIILHMLDETSHSFVDLAIARAAFQRVENSDGSNRNSVTIGVMQAINLAPSTYYPDLLRPFIPLEDNASVQSMDTTEYLRDKNMVEVRWDLGKTVGGIQIVKDFVIKAEPLSVELEQEMGEKLVRYIFQTDDDKLGESPLLAKSDPKSLEADLIGKPEHRESRLRLRPEDGSGHSPEKSATSGSSGYKNLSQLGDASITRMDEELGDEVDEMMQRASSYMSIIHLKVFPMTLKLSYNGVSGIKRMVNVHGLLLNLPEFAFANKLWTLLDIALELKKYVIKALLAQTGKILGNKMKIHNRTKKVMAHAKPLTNYANFTRAMDLVGDKSEVELGPETTAMAAEVEATEAKTTEVGAAEAKTTKAKTTEVNSTGMKTTEVKTTEAKVFTNA